MLRILTEKLNLWKKDGSEESKLDLFEIIQAIEAINRAQFWQHTGGMNPDIGARMASELAIAGAAEKQDAGTKQQMGIRSANAYIKRDSELKKTYDMVLKLKKTLGPVETNRPNPYLAGCVDRVKQIIADYEKNKAELEHLL